MVLNVFDKKGQKVFALPRGCEKKGRSNAQYTLVAGQNLLHDSAEHIGQTQYQEFAKIQSQNFSP